MNNFNQEQKYIVTGASSGIGEAIATYLNKHGASVIAIGRNKNKLEEIRFKCKYPKNMYIEVKDLVEDIDELPNYISALKDKYGKFAGLVCSAGIDHVDILRIFKKEIFENVLKINYTVPILLTKGFANKKNNIGEGASIVFIASTAGTTPDKGQISYAASKAALIASMKSISKELADFKIRCNSISPSWVNTPLLFNHEKVIGIDAQRYKLGFGEPNDIAIVVSYLLSDSSKWITGRDFILDGQI